MFSALSGFGLIADGPTKEEQIRVQQEKIEFTRKYGWAPSRRQPNAVPDWKGHSERVAKEEARLEEIKAESGIGYYLKFGALFVVSTGIGIVCVFAGAHCGKEAKPQSS